MAMRGYLVGEVAQDYATTTRGASGTTAAKAPTETIRFAEAATAAHTMLQWFTRYLA